MRASLKCSRAKATIGDLTAIRHLRQASLRVLAAEAYDRAAIESLTQDTSIDDAGMIRDGTLFVLELDGEVVACGGWVVDMPQPSPVSGRRSISVVRIRLGFNLFMSTLALRVKGSDRVLCRCSSARSRRADLARREIAATLNAMPFCTAMGYRPLGLVRELVPGSAHVIGAPHDKAHLRLVVAAAA